MNPIINPWFFFLLEKCDIFWGVCLGVLIISFVCGSVAFLIKNIIGNDLEKEYQEASKIICKAGFFWFFISLILILIVPSKNTIIKMVIAKNITPNNIEKTLQIGNDLKEGIKKDVFEIIDKIKEKE